MSKILTKLVPVDLLTIFERRHGIETFDRCDELRNEVVSFIDICFENMGYEKMFIKFPIYNMTKLKVYLKRQNPVFSPENMLDAGYNLI